MHPVAGVPLLVRILRTLQSEDIREAVIVTGYKGDAIERILRRESSLALKLHFVTNEAFDKSNGVSVLAAKDFVDGDCILTMADHLFSPEIVRSLQQFDLPTGCSALAVDYDIERCFDIDDATKVVTADGRIRSIGKELPNYNALDTGVFRIGPALIAELQKAYDANGDCTLSDGVSGLAKRGRMYGCGIGDARWIDVDTPEAAQRAEAMLQVFGDALGDEPGAGRNAPECIELFAPTWVRAAKPYNESHFAIAEGRRVTRMMSNESPFRPSERVVQAVVEAALGGNRYPSRAGELRAKLAARNGLLANQVLLGAGSAELIDLVVRTFVAPGEEVLLSVPTFSMYEARTRTVGGIPVMVPMRSDGDFDIAGLISSITERTKLIFLCSPNNPTGNRIAEPELRRILRLGLPTVIDEAYVELCQDPAARKGVHHLIAEFPNALIMRTFSKAYGLAGMRVGYALGHEAQIALVSRVKLPWNLSSMAIAAACAALEDREEQHKREGMLRRERNLLEAELAQIPGVEVIPSDGNFVLFDVASAAVSAPEVVERMLGYGIFLRLLRSHHGKKTLVRITVCREDDNARCVQYLRRVLGRAKRSYRGLN